MRKRGVVLSGSGRRPGWNVRLAGAARLGRLADRREAPAWANGRNGRDSEGSDPGRNAQRDRPNADAMKAVERKSGLPA